MFSVFQVDVFKMRFGVVLKWFGVVWCVLGWFGGCFHGPTPTSMYKEEGEGRY